MEKRYAIAIAVLAALAMIFGGTTAYFYMNYTESQGNRNSLSNKLGETEAWLEGNNTILQAKINELSQLQSWLDGNKTLLEETMAEREQIQEWLDGNITAYEAQIQDLNAEIASLNSQINSLNWQVTSLQNQISQLQKADLDGYAKISGTIYITVEGYVWNYGTKAAYGVSVTVCLTYEGTLVYSATKPIGNVQGRDAVPFDVSFTYAGLWDDWYWYVE